jgi:N-formylglutamate deformylase
MEWLHIHHGNQPVIISIPHSGQRLLAGQVEDLIDPDSALDDTDHFVDRLYDFALDMGISLIWSDMSRLVIDLNRDPNGVSLYPGQATTGLVPTTNFKGLPLYHEGKEPSATEIRQRLIDYYNPYHYAIEQEINRLRLKFGRVILYDAHSVRSVLPWLFEGVLPQFNIGTDGGRTCSPVLAEAIMKACGSDSVLNGRFKGGYITRHYSDVQASVETIQMELSKRSYMDEETRLWDDRRAKALQKKLINIMTLCLDHARGEI